MPVRFLALPAGFLLDLALGDPAWIPHPVILIGKLISFLEKVLRPHAEKKAAEAGLKKNGQVMILYGAVLVLITCILSFLIPLLVLRFLYRILPAAGFALETFWCFQLTAAKSLRSESMKVYTALEAGNTEKARTAVSRIVGRETDRLDREGIIKAAVETVAENVSDGVVAPLFYMALGGAPLMFLYKAINTMDSMIGYKNDRYLYFGKCAARLDDAANFIPSRISALLIILSAYAADYDGEGAFRIFLRDRKKHASPNSAQTESAAAGALQIQLGGDAVYFGKTVKKPVIGDPIRKPEPEDIPRVNRLAYFTSVLGAELFTVVFFLILRFTV